jgi:hypothetical protein
MSSLLDESNLADRIICQTVEELEENEMQKNMGKAFYLNLIMNTSTDFS